MCVCGGWHTSEAPVDQGFGESRSGGEPVWQWRRTVYGTPTVARLASPSSLRRAKGVIVTGLVWSLSVPVPITKNATLGVALIRCVRPERLTRWMVELTSQVGWKCLSCRILMAWFQSWDSPVWGDFRSSC